MTLVVPFLIAAFVVAITMAALVWPQRRRHSHFEPLEELELDEPTTRLVVRWPPRPVRVLPEREPTFHDGAEEGWFPS